MKLWLTGIMAVALVAPLALTPTAQAQSSPQEVVTALAATCNAHDIEATMALFADGAVVQILPQTVGGTHAGKGEIRSWFERIYGDNFQISVTIDRVEGDHVFTHSSATLDSLQKLGLGPLEFTEDYTIQSGKLAGFTSTYTAATVQALMAAFAPPQLPQTGDPAGALPLWALLLAGAALLAGGVAARLRLS